MGVSSHAIKQWYRDYGLVLERHETMMQAAKRRQSHTGVARMAQQVAQQLYSAMTKRKGGRGMEL